MAIKDRDGNVYKLRGPNPLMKEQKSWDSKHVKLINFGWDGETKEDENNPIEQFKKDYNVLDIGEELGLEPNPDIVEEEDIEEVIEAIEEEVEEVVEEVEPLKEEVPVQSFDKKTADFLQKHKVMVHCAPAIKVDIKDDLYGDTYQRTTYGAKEEFAAVITNQTDLDLKLWTTHEIQVDSVIYPQDHSKRWWRISEVEPRSGGFLASAVISNVNPDFT